MVSQAATATTPEQESPAAAPNQGRTKLEIKNLTIRYGNAVALQGVTLDVKEHEIFGIIGPANAGKTSFLKAINRMDMFLSLIHI